MNTPLTPQQRQHARVLWRRRRMPRTIDVYKSCWVADILGCACFLTLMAMGYVLAQIWAN